MPESSTPPLRILVDVSCGNIQDVLDAVAERSFEHDIYLSLLGNTTEMAERLTQVPYEAEFVQTIHCNSQDDALTYIAETVAKDGSKVAVASCQRSSRIARKISEHATGLLPGLTQPALTTIVPAVKGADQGDKDRYFTLLDVESHPQSATANAAILSALGLPVAQWFCGDREVRVGTLTLGDDSSLRDDQLADLQKVSALPSSLSIVGGISPVKALLGEADLVLSGGEAGAMFVHTLEATFVAAEALVERETKGVRGRLGVRIFRSRLEKLRDYGNVDSYGGSLLLGVQSPCVLLRPEAGVRAWMNALRILSKMHRTKVLEQQRTHLIHLGGITA